MRNAPHETPDYGPPEVVVAVKTAHSTSALGKQIFYGEFDGQSQKRASSKSLGE